MNHETFGVRMNRRNLISGAVMAGGVAIGTRRVGAQSASPAAGGPRVVQTIHGPVTVPANPVRIVAADFPITVALLELGITPVGRTSYLPKFPAGHATADDAVIVDDAQGNLDLEKIASLKPDLIIGDDWLDTSKQSVPFDELSSLAPTVILEWKQAAGNWEAEAAGTADAVGKTAELNAQREAYEQKAATVKSTYAAVNAKYTWDVIDHFTGGWDLYGPTSSHGKVAVAAGIQFNAAATQTDGYVQYSDEQFDLLQNTGALLIPKSVTDLNAVATFESLPAVNANRVFTSDYYFPSSYGLSTALLADIEAGLKQLQ